MEHLIITQAISKNSVLWNPHF